MTHRDKKKMEALQRRRQFLVQRVANYRKDGNPSYDKAELTALNWAISVINGCDSAGILEEAANGSL